MSLFVVVDYAWGYSYCNFWLDARQSWHLFVFRPFAVTRNILFYYIRAAYAMLLVALFHVIITTVQFIVLFAMDVLHIQIQPKCWTAPCICNLWVRSFIEPDLFDNNVGLYRQQHHSNLSDQSALEIRVGISVRIELHYSSIFQGE